MFAIFDMGKLAINTIKEHNKDIAVARYTVPGVKDLAIAAKKLIEEEKCDIALAFGYVGGQPLDTQCAHEANQGLIQAELMTNTHILKVFVHQEETNDPEKLETIFTDRTIKHTINALDLLKGKDALTNKAGCGQRQGSKHADAINKGTQ